MSDLLAHMTAPLKDGGHGLTEASYTVIWDDTPESHDWDHNSGCWFSEALLHQPHEPGEKPILKSQLLPADTSTTSTEDASAGARTRRQP